MAVVYFIQASKLVEMIPDIIGLVIVPCVLVVNELYTAWRQKKPRLDRDTRQKGAMVMFIPFNNSECQNSRFRSQTSYLGSQLQGREVRVCILRRR